MLMSLKFGDTGPLNEITAAPIQLRSRRCNMTTVYDMSTGQILETGLTDVSVQADAPHAYETELELGLQPITSEKHTKSVIPPELVLADLNAFLKANELAGKD
jgi:hypothetical protein